MPQLRIVDEALWERVKARQRDLHKVRAFHERRRPRKLLSFLLKCGCCGAGFSKVSQAHYGCSNARNKNTCDNRMVVRQDALEDMVLGALRSRLMDPALCAEFCAEYTRQLNTLRGAQNAALDSAKAELGKLARQRDNLIQALKDGVPASEVKDDLARIASRREELEAQIEGKEEQPVLLHPNMADFYRQQVAALADALNAESSRDEAAEVIRSLVDRIELTPNEECGKLEIDLYGDLAGILTLATKKDRPLDASDPSVQQVKMVAGAGFEPAAFRL